MLLLERVRVQYQNFKMSLKKERGLEGLEFRRKTVGNVVEDVIRLVVHPIMSCFDEIIIMRKKINRNFKDGRSKDHPHPPMTQ